jgi:hypothetical protein
MLDNYLRALWRSKRFAKGAPFSLYCLALKESGVFNVFLLMSVSLVVLFLNHDTLPFAFLSWAKQVCIRAISYLKEHGPPFRVSWVACVHDGPYDVCDSLERAAPVIIDQILCL